VKRAAQTRYCACGENCVGRVIRAAPTSAIAALASGSHPCLFSRGPRANRHCGQRSCDRLSSKLAASCDGTVDSRRGTFDRGGRGPVFSGRSRRKRGVMSLMADGGESRSDSSEGGGAGCLAAAQNWFGGGAGRSGAAEAGGVALPAAEAGGARSWALGRGTELVWRRAKLVERRRAAAGEAGGRRPGSAGR
jgi:hypothetical protein